MLKKTTQLKRLLESPQLEYLMEAHNGLSAKIVEETGFKAIWASGLSIAASMGVRDNNEASWTQVLDILEFMSDATTIPILIDGDTGYGNFNNARRLVKKLEQIDIAGVCIEDKLFPKTTLLFTGKAQPLASIEEFCGKIKAMKDTQMDDDFIVVARVEAFIAGWGVEEALTRAEAYRQAGADAVLIHSKESDFIQIETFMKKWNGRHPVVIVPTKYYSTPTSEFVKSGVNAVIWANHNLRASITAMQDISKQILRDESLIQVEDSIATVDEVFRLQNVEELQRAEINYLPKRLPYHNRRRSDFLLNTNEFGDELKKLGFDFYSGVPCSFLKSLINYAINECDYIAAANEGDAVAIAAGAYLGGKKSVVLMQNSGLTNAVSPLTSLTYPFQLPVLGFVSLRGEPGLHDEPQHELVGQITTQLLDLLQIKWQYLSGNFDDAKVQVATANEWIEKQQPFFFVVKKDTFESVQLKDVERSIHKKRLHSRKPHRMNDQADSKHYTSSIDAKMRRQCSSQQRVKRVENCMKWKIARTTCTWSVRWGASVHSD